MQARRAGWRYWAEAARRWLRLSERLSRLSDVTVSRRHPAPIADLLAIRTNETRIGGFTERTRRHPLIFFSDLLFQEARPVRTFDQQCAQRPGFSAQPRCCLVAGWRFSPPSRRRCTSVQCTMPPRRCRMRRITVRCLTRRTMPAPVQALAVLPSGLASRHRPRLRRRASSPSPSRSSRLTPAATPLTPSSTFRRPSDHLSSSVDASAARHSGVAAA